MTLKTYEEYALRTAKSKERLLTPQEYEMLECSCGLAGEGGELVDMVKKYIFHGHEFDVSKAMKELGDIHWYWSVMCATLKLDPDDVLAANVEKLKKRYPNGFNTEDSIARRDQNG